MGLKEALLQSYEVHEIHYKFVASLNRVQRKAAYHCTHDLDKYNCVCLSKCKVIQKVLGFLKYHDNDWKVVKKNGHFSGGLFKNKNYVGPKLRVNSKNNIVQEARPMPVDILCVTSWRAEVIV